MFWVIFTIFIIALSYWLFISPYNYWIKRGVKQGNPVPIFGDNLGSVLKTESFPEMIQRIYNVAPGTRYTGMYQFLTPTLAIKDPELIRQITVKDFEHFINHRSFISEDVDPIFGKSLFFLTGQRWREMRATLSPVFTSSKMKYMFGLMSKNGERFVNHFLNNKEKIIHLQMKDIFTKYTNDVIANTAFGVEVDSLADPKNEFYLGGQEITDFTGLWKTVKFFTYFVAPSVTKFFKLSLFSSKVIYFFKNLVKGNIESRENKGIVRPDLIHILLQARKSGLREEEPEPEQDTGFATVEESQIGKSAKNRKVAITDEDILAHAMVFFLAGFDAVATVMSFMAYELALNPNIQEELYQEIKRTWDGCNGQVTYELLLKMKYLDMVVSETLRKWPNAVGVDRVCTKAYTIEPKTPDEKPVALKEKDIIWLPIFAIHRDPRYYPNPEKFDPERFNDENKEKIVPYSYLPFGNGPRNCIGSRFALLETKVLFLYILRYFEIVVTEKTQIPLVLSKKLMSLDAKDGFWLGFKRRAD